MGAGGDEEDGLGTDGGRERAFRAQETPGYGAPVTQFTDPLDPLCEIMTLTPFCSPNASQKTPAEVLSDLRAWFRTEADGLGPEGRAAVLDALADNNSATCAISLIEAQKAGLIPESWGAKLTHFWGFAC